MNADPHVIQAARDLSEVRTWESGTTSIHSAGTDAFQHPCSWLELHFWSLNRWKKMWGNSIGICSHALQTCVLILVCLGVAVSVELTFVFLCRYSRIRFDGHRALHHGWRATSQSENCQADGSSTAMDWHKEILVIFMVCIFTECYWSTGFNCHKALLLCRAIPRNVMPHRVMVPQWKTTMVQVYIVRAYAFMARNIKVRACSAHPWPLGNEAEFANRFRLL